MLIVGITGGSGSGKTTVSQALGHIAGNSIDADAVYHELLESCVVMRKEIMERFPQARDELNRIDRKKLAKTVFSDAEALKDLNAITHRYVVREIERRIGDSYRGNSEITVIDAAALFESGIDCICDVTVGVVAPKELRIKRIMQRDNLDMDRAILRIDAQPEDSFYRERCDYIIDTGKNTSAQEHAEFLYQQIMEGMKLPNE